MCILYLCMDTCHSVHFVNMCLLLTNQLYINIPEACAICKHLVYIPCHHMLMDNIISLNKYKYKVSLILSSKVRSVS